MKISFIVLTYNRTEALLPVLRSLSVQCSKDHQVLIADDGSRAEHVKLLYDQCPAFQCQVLHIWHPDVGFTIAGARNLAVSYATGDYLVFLDGDCIPNSKFIVQHERLAEAGYFVNGSRVLLNESLSERVIKKELDLPSQSLSFWIHARLRKECNKILYRLGWPRRLFRLKHDFKWRGIRGCNMAVWKHDFININGFDETFQGWGHEDADFVLRLSHLGIHRKNGFMATEVFHLWHPESKRDQESINKNRVMQRMKTGLILAEKGLKELTLEPHIKITQLN